MSTPVIGSIGSNLDLLIKQGSTMGPFNVTLQNPDLTPMSLAGATIRGQIRKTAASTTAYDITVVINADQVGAGKGKFIFSMTDEQTAVIPADEILAKSKYVWDMELEDSAGSVIPLYYGAVQVFREVTHA